MGKRMRMMMRLSILALMTMQAIAISGPVSAADLGGGYCTVATDGRLWSLATNDELTSAVVALMDEAVAVSEDPRWANSSRPAFLWANEAKVACGKAYGYLRTSHRDQDNINRCECFHARMISYMN